MIDKTNHIPRYIQVKRILADRVRTGCYPPGIRIPGERDLANELGVSQMTVNKSILEMVDEGWLYREHGRGTFVPDDFLPPPPETLNIGIVSQVEAGRHLEDYYVGSLFRGMQQAVADRSVSFSIMARPSADLYGRLATGAMDGYLLVDLPRELVPDVNRLRESGRRVVVLSASWPDLGVPCVDSDNRCGARAAVEHLLNLGHTRIASVFTLLNTSNSLDRFHACNSALAERGIRLPSRFTISTEGAFESVDERNEQVLRLLDRADRPTAFFCAGYYSALETIQTIRKSGLTVPGDVSVVAFDDPVSAAHLTPPLTTVQQPLEVMGRVAMEKLLRWLTTRAEPARTDIMPTRLVVRGSTAPPLEQCAR